MAHRERLSVEGLGERGDIAAPIGSRAWAIAVRGELSVCLSDEVSNRWRIKSLTELFQESKGYEHLSDARGKPFETWRAFCTTKAPWGLNYDPDLIDAIRREGTQPIALRVEQAAEQTNGDVTPHGTNRYSNLEYSGNTLEDRSESTGISKATQWRLDYLARSAPELHEAVKRGEMGVRTAYDQARGKKTVSIPVDDVRAIARALVRHLTVDQIEELTRILVGG